MAEIPPDLRYTNDHEWAKVTQGNTVRVGITDFAQSSLGDIVFVSVHGMDSTVESGDTFGEVESTKSVSDLFSPVAGVVAAVNEQLASTPETINADSYGDGWLFELDIDDETELDDLLDADTYADEVAS